MSQEELKILKKEGFYFTNQSGFAIGRVTEADEKQQRRLFCEKIRSVLYVGHLKNGNNPWCLLRSSYLNRDVFRLIMSFVFGDSFSSWKYADGTFPLFWPIEPSYKSVSLANYLQSTNREGFLKTLEHAGIPKKMPIEALEAKELKPQGDTRRVGRCRIMGLSMVHRIEFKTVERISKRKQQLVDHSYISARRFVQSDLKNNVFIDPKTDFEVVHHDGHVFADSLYMIISNVHTDQKTIIFYSAIYQKAIVGHSNPWNPEFFEVFLNTRQRSEWAKMDPCDFNNRLIKEKEMMEWTQKNLDRSLATTGLLFKEPSRGELDEFHSNEIRDFRYGIFRYSPELGKLNLLPFGDINLLRKFNDQQLVGSIQHGMFTLKPLLRKRMTAKALSQKRKNIKRTYFKTWCFHRRDQD